MTSPETRPTLRSMYTRIHHPTEVPPADLDRYLRLGWYRIGQAMVTCRFVWAQDGSLRDAVWTRTDLHRYVQRRSHRRVNRRNRQRYRVVERPLVLDDEHEALYQRYLTVAQGQRPATLAGALHGGAPLDRFPTRELALLTQDGDLAGFCAFDLGNDSLQSLMGVYDPAFRRDGLGFWTLLLEVEHALELGLRYHYAGYVLPGDPTMDYKLRVGAMEYLDPAVGQWRPWEAFGDMDLPTERLDRTLNAVVDHMTEQGIACSLQDYRFHEVGAWNPQLGRTLAHPRVVVLDPGVNRGWDLLVVRDLDRRCYELLVGLRAEGRTPTEPAERVQLWVVSERLGLCESPERVLELARGRL